MKTLLVNQKIILLKTALLLSLSFSVACFGAGSESEDDGSKGKMIAPEMDLMQGITDAVSRVLNLDDTPAVPALEEGSSVHSTSSSSSSSSSAPPSPAPSDIPQTPPVIGKMRQILGDELYDHQVNVSKRFFSRAKDEFIPKDVHLKLIQFTYEYYTGNRSTIDITDLSARSRIYLLKSIINFKLNTLIIFVPNIDSYGGDKYTNKLEINNLFWKKKKREFDFTDQLPTTFKIGQFDYILTQGPTVHQRGSGRLSGLFPGGGSEKYAQIIDKMRQNFNNPQLFNHFPELLSQQKKDGIAIAAEKISSFFSPEIGDDVKYSPFFNQTAQFLNGFNFLLDYEVARRLVLPPHKEDKYQGLPVVFVLQKIIDATGINDNFETLKTYLAKDKNGSKASPVSAEYPDDRKSAVKNMTRLELSLESSIGQNLREELRYLHKGRGLNPLEDPGEDSGDDYKDIDIDFLQQPNTPESPSNFKKGPARLSAPSDTTSSSSSSSLSSGLSPSSGGQRLPFFGIPKQTSNPTVNSLLSSAPSLPRSFSVGSVQTDEWRKSTPKKDGKIRNSFVKEVEGILITVHEDPRNLDRWHYVFSWNGTKFHSYGISNLYSSERAKNEGEIHLRSILSQQRQ